MKIHTRSKKNFDSCQVTPGGPWKGFSCYQIPLINLYGMTIHLFNVNSSKEKNILSTNHYHIYCIRCDFLLQSEFDTYKFSDYKGKNCELLVILPEHFPSKIVYEMAHLLEKKFVISFVKIFKFIPILNKLQICCVEVALKRSHILKILSMPS